MIRWTGLALWEFEFPFPATHDGAKLRVEDRWLANMAHIRLSRPNYGEDEWFRVSGVGCRVLGVGCRVSGVGCRVSGVGCRVSGFGFRVSGVGCRVSGFGFRVSDFGRRVSGVGCRVSGSGFQDSGLGFRASGFRAHQAVIRAAPPVPDCHKRNVVWRRVLVHLLGSVDHSFRALSGSLKVTV